MPKPLNDFELFVEDFGGWRQGNNPYALIDVRDAEEVEKFSFEKAQHIPLERLYDMEENLPRKEEIIVLVCAYGQRSLKACFFLRHQGFNNIYSLSGGVTRWQKFQQERNS
ncbi:MAG: rhodanese-like domain-containing protein [bacterium]|nr:rhodanese-like domain-containing protein [bacterium]